MENIDKLTISIMVLTMFCSQTYAAGFVKYDGIKGESIPAQNQNHKKWINLDSISMPLEKAPHYATERSVERFPKRTGMEWDNVRNKSWKGGSAGVPSDRPTEEVSFYFNKISARQAFPGSAPHPLPAPNKRITTPNKPQTIGLLLPAVQKAR
ncbi:MAG: hypothetical protein V7739_04660 [Motiliproteus sp.]